jgi:putative isomerase
MTVPGFLRTPNVPVHRAWNSWAADRYLDLIHLPLGVRLSPMLFSAAAGTALFPGPGHEVRLGTHAADGSRIEAEVAHGGTVLDWGWARSSPFALEGHWRVRRHGEWALRFWVVLVLTQEDGAPWHWDAASGTAACTIGPRTVAVRPERAPLLVTGHATAAAAAAEYEARGYWYLDSRSAAAPALALRFNLEEAPENRLAVAIADRPDLAVARTASPPPPPPARSLPASRAAIRDIMGWNTIWDRVNHRPYITCSRNWDLKKFGGFGFWLNDMAVNALLVSLFDPNQGRECLSYLLAAQTPEGNLPCIVTGNDAWVDRTQSPLVGFIVWQLYRRLGERSLLEEAWPVLAANNAWLRRVRDGNGNGLLEYGSSDVGLGLYRGTKLGAKDESFMDNSPAHDEARWMPASRTLDCEDVGLNSLVALDCEMLGEIAAALGQDPAPHRADAAALRAKIAAGLWDDARGIFANRLWSGHFVRPVTPTSFFPLLAGAASPAQTAALVARLADPRWFGGTPGLPSVARHDPAFGDNVYWRGRIWPILNWLVWEGLRRVGATAEAEALRAMSLDLFGRSWERGRLAPENYHAGTGEGLDQPDTDPFYSWTALLPWMDQPEAGAF